MKHLEQLLAQLQADRKKILASARKQAEKHWGKGKDVPAQFQNYARKLFNWPSDLTTEGIVKKMIAVEMYYKK